MAVINKPDPEDDGQPDLNLRANNIKSSRGPMGEWLRELRNSWESLTDDEQSILSAAPLNIHPNRASIYEKIKSESIKKISSDLQNFQEKYLSEEEKEAGVGIRPPRCAGGRQSLNGGDLSLGASIVVDLRKFRVTADNNGGKKTKSRIPLSQERVELYRKFNLREFVDPNDTADYTLLTVERDAEYCKSNDVRCSGRRRNNTDDTSGPRTTRSAKKAASTSSSTASEPSTKRTSTSTSTESNPAKKRKTRAQQSQSQPAQWTPAETKQLEELESIYGSAWLLFENDPDCLPGKTKKHMARKWEQIKEVRPILCMYVYFHEKNLTLLFLL